MKNNLFNLSNLIVFAIIYPNPVILRKYCDNDYFESVSLNSYCQRENGQLVSCRGSLYNVEKAYIECHTGYFNKQNVSRQVLNCTNDGEWSDKVIECYPECIESPDIRNITLINDDKTKFPESYVEIIRKEFEEGVINRFPGLILSAKYILILTKYIDFIEEFKHKFTVRVFNTKRKFIDHDISTVYKIVHNEFSIIYLNCYDYIKFNEDVKPICPDSKMIAVYGSQLKVFIEYPVIHCRKCIADYDDPKVENLCFQRTESYNYSLIECSEKSDFILARCEIGYQYIKSVSQDRLSYCMSNIWIHQENDCHLICGKIDQDYNTFQNKSNQFPWHVNIYNKINIKLPNIFRYICSGTIIHSNIVISATSCYYNHTSKTINEASNFFIETRQNSRNYEKLGNNSFYTGIKEIYFQQKPYSEEMLNDIAVLILEKHLKFTINIRPACLDFKYHHEYSVIRRSENYVIGWSPSYKIGSNFGDAMRTTKLTTLRNDQCKSIVDHNFRSQITNDNFCAISENNNSSICVGGGFLVKKDIGYGERYYLTGIVSNITTSNWTRKIDSCSDGFVTLLTNIQLFQNSIKDIISYNRNVEFFNGF